MRRPNTPFWGDRNPFCKVKGTVHKEGGNTWLVKVNSQGTGFLRIVVI